MKRTAIIILTIVVVILAILFFGGYFSGNQQDKNTLTLFGNVDVRQVDLGFRVEGRVNTMHFQEGDLVTKDTLMGFLDKTPYTDQVKEAEANIASAKANLENAQRLQERRKTLLASKGVSKEDFENSITTYQVYAATLKQAEAALGVAHTSLDETELYAPNDGTILTRIREPGAIVRPSDPIYTLTLISPVWIRAFVSEPDLGRIYPGMKAEIFTDVKGGVSYPGHIGFISPVAEFTPKTVETTKLRTDLVYRLRIIADNPDKFLKQGMPVTVKLRLDKPAEGKKSE